METIAPIQSTPILEKGHSFSCTSMPNSFQHKPTWEIYHQSNFCFSESCEDSWHRALSLHSQSFASSSLDEDWVAWCETFQSIHNPNGSTVGLDPRYRLRDHYKHSKLHAQLCHAIRAQDWQLHKTVLSKLEQIGKNQLRKWRQQIQMSGQSHHSWLKHLFKWARTPAPPIPCCIASNKYGHEGFTTGLHDSLKEITDYFSVIYKSENVHRNGHNCQSQAYVVDDEQIHSIDRSLQQVLSKSDASRA